MNLDQKNAATRIAAPVPVSAVVMTFNEEPNLQACLKSMAGWGGEVFVVDSFSVDRTEDIARRYPVHFVQHAYESHPAQWNWALKNLPFQHEWILAMDADFRMTPELMDAISRALPTISEETTGIYVRHRQMFLGRWMRHGTIYPRYWLRLFRRQAVFIDESDLVDVHFYVQGKTSRLEYDVIEDNQKDRNLSFWVNKQMRFAERAAVEEIKRRRGAAFAPIPPALFSSPDQRTLWLKKKWARLPLYWRAVLYFLYRYFLRLGFLDGSEGFLYHFTQALLYRIAVDAHLERLARSGLENEALDQQLKPVGPAAPVHVRK